MSSELEIEFGKHGVEIEMKGKTLFWLVTISALAGFAAGVVVGLRAGNKIEKIKKL